MIIGHMRERDENLKGSTLMPDQAFEQNSVHRSMMPLGVPFGMIAMANEDHS